MWVNVDQTFLFVLSSLDKLFTDIVGKATVICSVHRLQIGRYNGRRRNGPRATRYQTYRKYTDGLGKGSAA